MNNFKEKSADHKKKAKQYNKDQALNFEKQTFYQTKNVVAKSGQKKSMEDNNALLKIGKNVSKKVADDKDQDRLLKELSYTKRELI